MSLLRARHAPWGRKERSRRSAASAAGGEPVKPPKQLGRFKRPLRGFRAGLTSDAFYGNWDARPMRFPRRLALGLTHAIAEYEHRDPGFGRARCGSIPRAAVDGARRIAGRFRLQL